MNCSKLIGDRSRFYLHCLSSSTSLSGDTYDACNDAFFLSLPRLCKRHLSTIKHCATYIGLARARARGGARGNA